MIATMTPIADAHDIWKSGRYYARVGATANVPLSGIICAEVYGYMYITLTLYTYDLVNGVVILQQTLHGNKWGEWEYVNPPMVAGVEYRTTERHYGAVVYRKLVTYRSAGEITGSFSVPHGISNFDGLVECRSTIDRTVLLPNYNGDFITFVSSVGAEHVNVTNNNPYFNQNYGWWFELRYTKIS